MDFRINQVLAPLTARKGIVPVAGVVLLTAFSSFGAQAKANSYPSMHASGGKIPSVYSSGSDKADSQRKNNAGQNANASSTSKSKTPADKTTKAIESLQKKGLEIVSTSCASATYRMLVDSENASRFSMREKIIAMNFIQPFLNNTNEDLLSRYATAISAADEDYTYDWKNFKRSAKSDAKSLDTSPHERSVENSIEKTTNEGAKAIFDAIGFSETSDKIQEKIEKIERQERRNEEREQRRELTELDKRLTSILNTVSEQMKQQTMKLNFTSEEARIVNKQFYHDIIGLLNPSEDLIAATESACSIAETIAQHDKGPAR
jgi:hypothetical protein